jgi:hypothetical protein
VVSEVDCSSRDVIFHKLPTRPVLAASDQSENRHEIWPTTIVCSALLFIAGCGAIGGAAATLRTAQGIVIDPRTASTV